MKPINVQDGDFDKIIKIQKEKKFSSRAKVVEYLIYLHTEQQFRQLPIVPKKLSEFIAPEKEAGSASPIIDAEKLQNKQFIQLGGIKKP